MKTLLLTSPMPNGYFEGAIRALAPELSLTEFHDALDDRQLEQFDAILAWRLPPGLVARMPNLRWICAVSAGVDKLLVPELHPDVLVSRIVDSEQAQGIAQYVSLMALRHARRLTTYEEQQRQRVWKREPVTVSRSTVAMLGMGEIGRAASESLIRLGFEVEGWNRSNGRKLADVLSQADIIVCALPLTPETRGLLNRRTFALVRPGAYLINVARGEHIVEADLIEAVQAGQLSGAALDVQCSEPMTRDDPLWDAPAVTLTPHIAAQPSPSTIATHFVEGLRCLREGKTPPQTIDRLRGY